MKMQEFLKNLEGAGYVITDPVAATSVWLAIRDRGNGHIPAVVLDGPPGTGKTFLAEKTAEVLGAKMFFFQFFRGAGKEEMLFDLDLSRVIRGMSGDYSPEKFVDMLSLGVLPQAIRASQDRKVVLVLDEMDKAHPSTDALLLDFLQSARLHIPHIGELQANSENLLVIFTKNDERDLAEPLLRRCRPVLMSFPSAEVEVSMIESATAPGSPGPGQTKIRRMKDEGY